MSNIDVQYLQFDVKTRSITFSVVSTTCAFPIIMASSTLISFDRKTESPFGLTMDNLTFSSFAGFIDHFIVIEEAKDYTLSMIHADGRFYKFFYLVCPFYVSEIKDTVIQMASILSNEDVNVVDPDNNKKYPVQFDSKLPLETFIENALLNVNVKKVYLDSLMDENKVNKFNVDFSSTLKYFLFINKPRMIFKMISKKEIYFKIILIDVEGKVSILEKKSHKIMNFTITEEDKNHGFYFYIENMKNTQSFQLYIETFDKIEEPNESFFYNFWGYFIIVLAGIISIIIIWIIIQRFMNKKRLKKMQDDLDSKLREQHSVEIQRQSEKLSVILMGSKKKKNEFIDIGKIKEKVKSKEYNTESETSGKEDNSTSEEDHNTSRESGGGRDFEKKKSGKRELSRNMTKSSRRSKISKKASSVNVRSRGNLKFQTKDSTFAKKKTFKKKINSLIENLIKSKTVKNQDSPRGTGQKFDPYKFAYKSKKLAKKRNKKKKIRTSKSMHIKKMPSLVPKHSQTKQFDFKSQFTTIDVRTNN